MRTFLVVLLCLAFLLVLGIGGWSYYFVSGSNRSLAGIDRSSYSATAVPRHVEALQRADAAARKEAAVALWQIAEDAREANPALLAAARDRDALVREAVVQALGRTSRGTLDAVPTLTDALKDKEEGVRAAAALALAGIWDADGRAGEQPAGPSQGGRRGNAPPAQVPASSGSSRLSPQTQAAVQPAIPLLTEALRDSSARVRTSAATALGVAGPLAEPALEKLTEMAGKEPDDKARLQAAIALGNIGPRAKAAVPVLLDRLSQDKVDGIRANVAVALGQIRADAPVVVPALAEMFLREEFGDVRGAAVQGLQHFGPEARFALPVLQAAAKDPQYQQKGDLLENLNRLLRQMERNLPKEGSSPQAPVERQGTDEKR
jgi:HEAT repeat protein